MGYPRQAVHVMWMGLALALGARAGAQPKPAAPAGVSTPDALLDQAEAAPGRSGVGEGLDSAEGEAGLSLEEETAEALSNASAKHILQPGDVEPYLDHDHPAMVALRGHHYGAARKLLEQEPDSPHVRYLKAFSAFEAGQAQAAATEFEALADTYPALQDLCHYHAGLAEERLHHFRAAATEFGKVDKRSTAFQDSRLRMAQALHRIRDLRAAMEALSPLMTPETPPQVQAKAFFRVADLSRDLGLVNAEHRALLAAWATDPKSAISDAARRRLRGAAIPYKWRAVHAESLINLHHGPEALRELAAMLPRVAPPDEVACRVRFAYGLALRQDRQHAAAIRVLAPLLQSCQSPQLLTRVRFVLAYSQSVLNPAAAVQTYLELAQTAPADKHADAAVLIAAELLNRQGLPGVALNVLQDFVQRCPDHPATGKAWFARFWVHWNEDELNEGLKDLTALLKLPEGVASHDDLERAAYWQARALERLGSQDQAADHLERLVIGRASSFYGMLALRRLELLDGPRAERLMKTVALRNEAEVEWPVDVSRVWDEPHFRTGLELLRLGLPRASSELLAVDRSRLSENTIALLFGALNSAGHPGAARALARSVVQPDEPATPPSVRSVLEAAFPRKFEKLVQRHSGAARVDPHLMEALIREESGFNPSAHSSTGALGLTQLMPKTAAAMARALHVPGGSASVLLNPTHSIRLGSAYLGSLLRHFSGNEVLAVASYNAGPGAVDKWLHARPNAELDEFVEEIPAEETRLYVKRVLSSYVTYKLLYPTAAKEPRRTRALKREALRQDRRVVPSA